MRKYDANDSQIVFSYNYCQLSGTIGTRRIGIYFLHTVLNLLLSRGLELKDKGEIINLSIGILSVNSKRPCPAHVFFYSKSDVEWE